MTNNLEQAAKENVTEAAKHWAKGFHGNQPRYEADIIAFKAGAKWQASQPKEGKDIPPGIVAFEAGFKEPLILYPECFPKGYADWVNHCMNIENYPIHAIEVDGKQWSVGEKAEWHPYEKVTKSEGVIKSFSWNNDQWTFTFEGWHPILAVSGLSKPTSHASTLPSGDTAGYSREDMIGFMEWWAQNVATDIENSKTEYSICVGISDFQKRTTSQLLTEYESQLKTGKHRN